MLSLIPFLLFLKFAFEYVEQLVMSNDLKDAHMLIYFVPSW